MEKEKLDKTIKAGMEKGLTADEWYVALITSIASSLAVIADKLTEKESQENFNKDSETESMLKADLISRQNCKYRHENGNCLAVGGFCLSVDDEHCQYEAVAETTAKFPDPVRR